MNNWQYDETNNIYYQIGLVYCMNPEDTAYESCGIYVPGEYFDGTKNSNHVQHLQATMQVKLKTTLMRGSSIWMLVAEEETMQKRRMV